MLRFPCTRSDQSASCHAAYCPAPASRPVGSSSLAALCLIAALCLVSCTALKSEQGPKLLDSREWKFAAFGTSTKPELNRLIEGIEPSTLLSKPNTARVILQSCSVNPDGSIKAKGGKFVATDGYDGISFYYTRVRAKGENFYLQADIRADYINPSPDGQEGFALLARDSIGKDGISDRAFYTNSRAAIGTALPFSSGEEKTTLKDALGWRAFSGISDEVYAPEAGSFALESGTFDGELIEAGKTYTLSLEKTNSSYIMSRYERLADNSLRLIGRYESPRSGSEDYPLALIDPDWEYVGFAVARGCNAQFSHIIFRITDAALDPPYEPRQAAPQEMRLRITSPQTASGSGYELVFTANAAGRADVYADNKRIEHSVKVRADEPVHLAVPIQEDSTFSIEFTPSDRTALSKPIRASKRVSYRSLPDTIHVSPSGRPSNSGLSFEDALDPATAIAYAEAGQTILLSAGRYSLPEGLLVERGRDGRPDAPITVRVEKGDWAVFDFEHRGTGWKHWGSYWHIVNVDITCSADGSPGMQLAGNRCTLSYMNFYNNGNTGLQISSSSSENRSNWPAHNLIQYCTSVNNADSALEDADGFAAKLTSGEGNVFDGCIAAYNADDGWDLFAKTATGGIGSVLIKNSLTYGNGFIVVSDPEQTEPVSAGDRADPGGRSLFTGTNYGTVMIEGGRVRVLGRLVDAGNGNGFKLGGSALRGAHRLENSLSYENKAKGIDSNSCPDVKILRCTSFNNGGANIALYSHAGIQTDFRAEGIISFRDRAGPADLIQPSGQNSLLSPSNYIWDGGASVNARGERLSADMFESLDTAKLPARRDEGSIDTQGLLMPNALAPQNTGARL